MYVWNPCSLRQLRREPCLAYQHGSLWRDVSRRPELCDGRATDEQREALRLIVSGEAGGGFFTRRKDLTGTFLGVKFVPILYESAGRRRKVSIPNALEMELEAVTGAHPDQEVQMVNLPRAGDTGFYPTTVAKAVAHSFGDYGLSWDNTGKNSYYRQFELSGP